MSPRIDCRQAVERLWAYLDNELDGVDHDAVEDHLALCLRCCGELAFARELRAMLAGSATADMPPEVQERLEHFADCLPIDETADHEGSS